ncbi:MAG: CPBP family intramembrane glutamic endopeptidase [Duganella sp.]
MPPLTVVTLFLLAGAICAVWAPSIPIRNTRLAAWILPALAAAVCGLLAGVVHVHGLVALVALAGAAVVAAGSSKRPKRLMAGVFTIVLALALATHWLPGFDNPVLIRKQVLSHGAVPFTQYANLDKGAVGLILLALLCNRVRSWRAFGAMLGASWLAMLVTLGAVFGLGTALGLVRFDMKLPPLTWQFLAVNLFFTVVAEEAFFRGLLQERLAAALARFAWGPAVAVLASALLFGLVHLGGGALLALMAGVAGLGYAVAYQATRRIEAAILLHILVNGVHFVFFTYPSLLKAHGV